MGSISLVMSKKDIKISIHGLNLPRNEQKRHKITNVPLFKKIWDIIFLGGYFFYYSRDWAHESRLFWAPNRPRLRLVRFHGAKKSLDSWAQSP